MPRAPALVVVVRCDDGAAASSSVSSGEAKRKSLHFGGCENNLKAGRVVVSHGTDHYAM